MKSCLQCVLIMLSFGRVHTAGRSDVEQARFRAVASGALLPQQIDSSPVEAFPARSKLDCARICRKHRYCFSFVFDPDAGSCSPYNAGQSLEVSSPSSAPSSAPPPSAKVYEMAGAPPDPVLNLDLETISRAEFFVYNRQWSVKANVTCNDNFTLGDSVNGSDGRLQRTIVLTYSEDEVQQWIPATGDVHCSQSAWVTNSKMLFNKPIPRTVIPGWRLCMNGTWGLTPNINELYQLLLTFVVSPTQYKYFTLDVNFDKKSIQMQYGREPSSVKEFQLQPSSFENVEQFSVMLEAVDESKFNITFNSDWLLGQYDSIYLLSSIQSVTAVSEGQGHVYLLDTWC